MTKVYTNSSAVWENVSGGLYCLINQIGGTTGTNQLMPGSDDAPISNFEIEPLQGELPGTASGYIAYQLNVTFDNTASRITLSNPYSGASASRYAFGEINVYVNPTSGKYGSAYLTLSGFNNVDEFVEGMNLTAGDEVKEGFSLYLQAGGKTYLWQSNARKQFNFVTSY